MSVLVWDKIGDHFYETGVDRGVLYPMNNDGTYGEGVAWNGLTAVTESPSGGEANPIWADNIKYLNLLSAEEFGATIEAYTYPDEFAECDGSAELADGVTIGQQKRKSFGFCYRSIIGNDTEGNDHGYKLHLIYGCVAAPSEKGYATVSDSPEPITLSWEISTTPVEVDIPGSNLKPTACLTIDTTKINKEALIMLEARLYGNNNSNAGLPLPGEVLNILTSSMTPID